MWPNDTDEIRDELRDYYGTAVVSGFPAAAALLFEVEDLDDEEVRELAEELGLDE